MSLRSLFPSLSRRSRTPVVLAGVAALTLAVGACGNSSAASSDGKGTVTFFSWDTQQVMQPVIDEFQKENRGITVSFSYAPPVPTYINTLQKRLLAKTAADVFILGNHTQQAGGGYVKALDGTAAAQVQSSFGTKMNTYSGHVYGISIATWGGGLLVNLDLAKKAGITTNPTSWSELLTDLGKLKSSGVTPIMEGGDGVPTAIMGLIGMADKSAGGLDAQIYNGQTTFSQAWTGALDTWSQLYTGGYASKNDAALKGAQTESEFENKKVAMISDGSWAIAGIRKAMPGTGLAFWPIPGTTTGQTYWAGAASPPYAINAHARNSVGAQKFVDFLSSAKGVQLYHEQTGSITTTSNYKPQLDSALSLMYPDVIAGNVWCTWQAWPGANSDPLDASLLAGVQEVMQGHQKPAEVTAALDQKWSTLK